MSQSSSREKIWGYAAEFTSPAAITQAAKKVAAAAGQPAAQPAVWQKANQSATYMRPYVLSQEVYPTSLLPFLSFQ